MTGTLRFFWKVFWMDLITGESPERIKALQESRLRRLLRHAVDHARHYKQRFKGIDIDKCDLSDLPTLTKGELMENYDKVVTDPKITRLAVEEFIANPANHGKLFLDRYVVCHTSGSQGQPAFVVQEFDNLMTAY